MHTKAGFSQVPVPGYLPSSYEFKQTDTDQIIQTANEEVASTDKEMQVIMQSDNKHLHINKTGSFSRLRSFELNDMGYSLNRISLIMFDVENQQIPANHGTRGRLPTLMPRDKKVPQNTQQRQTYDEVVNMNEAHHEPQGGASYNPDESVTNKSTFQNVQGRFILLKVSNMPTQPQQQQQSSSEEGSKENTILNGPRHQRKWVHRIVLQAQQTVHHKDQLLQHLHIHHKLEDHQELPQSTIRMLRDVKHVIIINICPKIIRIYWNAMEPPMDPLEHLEKTGKGPGPTKGKSKTSEPHPGTSSGTGSTAQPAGSSKNTIVCSACGESGHWSKNCPYFNFCDVCKVTTHSTHMCRVSKHGNATAGSPVCIYCGKTNH